jgi:alpha-1,2-mannosyltransferase
VRSTVYLGQINLVLLAIVAWDLLRPAHRWTGVGVGLAAGIKLTPLIFAPYLLLTAQFRAALVASATFAGTVLVGFALSPGNSRAYWLHATFATPSRVGSTTVVGNQSLRGTLARWLGEAATVPWLGVATLLGVAALLVAAAAHRRGDEVLGTAITGLAAAAVAPFSWPHHWVWFVPLALFLAAARSWVALLALSAATLAFVTDAPSRSSGAITGTGLISVDPSGVLGWLCHNVYRVTFVVIIAIAAGRMACNAGRCSGYLPA